MQAVFLIIKQVELVDKIMSALADAGIKGGTAIDSEGMASSIARSNTNMAMVQLLSANSVDERDKLLDYFLRKLSEY